jgi:hypothetical protein
MLDDFSCHNRREDPIGKWQSAFHLRSNRPKAARLRRPQGHARNVHADHASGLQGACDELAIVAANVQQAP